MRILFSLFLTTLVIVMPATADDAADPFARDILILSDWFEGEFDNEEQRWFHARSRAEGEAHVRIHTAHKRLDLPDFGEHVFYVEEYRDNDPQEIIRQRLVIFTSDPEADAIRMRQGFFKKPDDLVGAHNDPSKAAHLSNDDVSFLDSCDVFVRRHADQFEGAMKEKTCVFGEGDLERYSVHNVTISATKFWRVDATFLVADDSFHKGTPLNEPTELRRADFFVCDVYFYGEDRRQEQVVEDLRVHNQGGTANVVRQRDKQAFELLLRNKEYPYYASRPDFIYYALRRPGEILSEFYGVADAQSRQFGTNAGKVGVFCHREGYTFRQALGEL